MGELDQKDTVSGPERDPGFKEIAKLDLETVRDPSQKERAALDWSLKWARARSTTVIKKVHDSHGATYCVPNLMQENTLPKIGSSNPALPDSHLRKPKEGRAKIHAERRKRIDSKALQILIEPIVKGRKHLSSLNEIQQRLINRAYFELDTLSPQGVNQYNQLMNGFNPTQQAEIAAAIEEARVQDIFDRFSQAS